MPEPTNKLNFEQALEELGRIVHELEDGALGLEASLARYEQGVQLLKQCYGFLERAEKRIALVTTVRDDGTVRTKPFDGTATLETEEKRTRTPAAPNRQAGAEAPFSDDPAPRRPPQPVETDEGADDETEDQDRPMLF